LRLDFLKLQEILLFSEALGSALVSIQSWISGLFSRAEGCRGVKLIDYLNLLKPSGNFTYRQV
jgi:hypothetical protein